MASGQRPLSPHLLIYRPQVTSVLSILHRIFGVVLAIGALLFTYWLTAGAYGPEAYGRAQAFLGSWFGRLVLFGFTFTMFYHLCNGIRHLAWDAVWGFEMPRLKVTGAIVVVVSVTLTLVTWFAAYRVAGAL